MAKTEQVNKLQIKQIDEQLVKLEKNKETRVHNKKLEKKIAQKKEEHDELSSYFNAMFDKPSRRFEDLLPSEMVQVVAMNEDT